MASLLPTPRAYSYLPQRLVQKVPEFAESPEYKALGSTDLQLPGVVCGTFPQFLSRLQKGAIEGIGNEEGAASLSASYHVLEW